MAVIIEINGVDKSSEIDPVSVNLQRFLTSQVDSLNFTLKRKSAGDYKPVLGDTVKLKEDSSYLFGGVIITIDEEVDGMVEYCRITCKDFSFEMDRKLVIETYTSTTVNAIIADINSTYLTGFDITNVDCPEPVDSIQFNYQQPSKCLQTLAEMFQYDWYVDHSKKIFFFSKTAITAPFSLTDTNGKYIYNSLKIKKDIRQLKNTIYVRGGEYLGTSNSETQIADGSQKVFLQMYKYSGISVTDNGVGKTVGIDGIDDPTGFDCLYNFNEKAIKFATAPTATHSIVVTGQPYLPIIVKVPHSISVTEYGTHEAKIIDKTLGSKQSARDRAQAELAAWGLELDEGSFRTYETGLEVGMLINITSTLRSISDDYLISRIASRMHTRTTMEHEVVLVSKMTFGMVEFLQKLLTDKDREIEIKENEILDKVEAPIETITLTDSVTASKVHTTAGETALLVDVTNVRALNYGVKFVVGPFKPTDGLDSDTNLKGKWEFDDNAVNTVVTDAKGTYNGTASANTNTLTAEGKHGLCFRFTGSQYFTIASLAPATAFGFSFLFKLSSFTANDRIIDYQDGGPSGGFSIVLSGTDSVVFSIRNGATQVASITKTGLALNTWYHCVVSYAVNNVNMWIDNVLAGTDTSATMSAPTQTVTVGRRSASASNFFNGYIEALKYFDRALVTADVQELYDTVRRQFILDGSPLA